MATDKKSFILYADLIHTVNKIPDETAGKLLKHILAYVNDLNPETDDLLVEVAFEPIKQAMKRDLKKWETQIDRKSQGAILGNLKRWHTDLYEKVQANQITLDEAQSIAKHRIPSHSDKTERIATKSIASIAVSVNDSVNVSVNDSVSVNDIEINKDTMSVPAKVGTTHKKAKRFFNSAKKEDYPESEQNFFVLARGFFDVFWTHAKELDLPLKNLKEADADEWTKQIRLMIEKKEATLNQIIEVGRFLKTDNFWKTNCRSVPKLREKFDNIYSSSKKIQNGNQQTSTLEDPEFQAMVMAKFAASPNFQGVKND